MNVYVECHRRYRSRFEGICRILLRFGRLFNNDEQIRFTISFRRNQIMYQQI